MCTKKTKNNNLLRIHSSELKTKQHSLRSRPKAKWTVDISLENHHKTNGCPPPVSSVFYLVLQRLMLCISIKSFLAKHVLVG